MAQILDASTTRPYKRNTTISSKPLPCGFLSTHLEYASLRGAMPFSIRPYRRCSVHCAVMIPRSLLRKQKQRRVEYGTRHHYWHCRLGGMAYPNATQDPASRPGGDGQEDRVCQMG